MSRITSLSDEPSVRWFIERAPASVCAAAGSLASFPPELRGAVRAGLVGVVLGIMPPEPLELITRRRVIAGDCLVFCRSELVGLVPQGEVQPTLPGQVLVDAAAVKRAQAHRRREARSALLLLVRDALGRQHSVSSATEGRPALRDENPYAVLGLVAGATRAEVKRARLTLLRQYHPDKVATLGIKLQQLAEEESKRINRAADALEKAFAR